MLLLGIIGTCVDGDKDGETEKMVKAALAETEKKDSVVVNEPLEGDPYQELDDLIGLGSVKQEVRSLANFVKLQKEREAKGLKTAKVSYHLVFYGSPGTGKTTVARIVGRIYKDLGVLKKGHTVETDRAGLCGQYVGQTGPKTDSVIAKALDGVLFIDEAYSLVPEGGSGNDYGDSILDGLYFKEHWFSAAGWGGGLDPQLTFTNGVVTLTVPGVGGEEWMGQVKLVADVAASPETEYSFRCKVEASTDGKCTIKVADANADAEHAFFHDNNVSLTAYDELSYVKEPVSPDQAYQAVMVIFDFGRMAPGTEITIRDITLSPKK